MRLSELLTSEVVTEGGERVGHVRDVRLVRDGPPLPGFGPSYRVHELLVGKGSLGARLGLDREHIAQPVAACGSSSDDGARNACRGRR